MMIGSLLSMDASSALPVVAALAALSFKSVLLLVAAGVIIRFLPDLSAADRHLIWTVSAVATLALPLLSLAVPNLGVRVFLPATAVALSPAATDGDLAGVASTGMGLDLAGVASTEIALDDAFASSVGIMIDDAVPSSVGSGVSRSVSPADGSLDNYAPLARSASEPAPVPVDMAGADDTDVRSASSSASVTGLAGYLMARWAPVAGLLLWVSVAGVLLISLAGGWIRLARIERRAEHVTSGPWSEIADRAAAKLGLRHHPPTILKGGRNAVPMTWGVFQPKVLLPSTAEEWEGARLEAVLTHELAHARRRDYLAQLLVHVACAVQWFNPMLWVAASRMRREREFACDDFVLALGLRDGPAYATDLLDLARAFRPGARAPRAGLAMARPSTLRTRLTAVLDQSRPRRPLARPRAWACAALLVPLAAVLSAVTPAEARTDVATAGMPASASGLDSPDPLDSPGIPASPNGLGSRSEVSPQEASLVTAEAAQGASMVTSANARQEAGVLCGPADGEERTSMHVSNDGRIKIEHEFSECRSTVEIEGDIEFTSDFTSIQRLPSDARFRAEVRRGRSERQLDVRPGSRGVPEFQWRVDGQEQPFDAAAQRWFERMLLEVFRTSSYQAMERAAWMLETQGVDAVFAEVEVIGSDHVRRRYLSALLETGDLDPDEVRRVITLASSKIESDHNLGQILITAVERYRLDPATRTVFIDASRSIESDHQQGKVFEQALAWRDLNGEEISVLLAAAADDIESDHTLAGLLIGLAERYPMNQELRRPFLRAAARLESDHRKGEVYETLLEQEELSAEEVAEVLRAATTIDSDNRLSKLLVRLADQGLPDGTTQTAYLEAASDIASDSSLRAALEAFMESEGVDDQGHIAMFRTARGIASDSQLARLLVTFADQHRVEGDVRVAFLEAMSAISSDSQVRKVQRAIDEAR